MPKKIDVDQLLKLANEGKSAEEIAQVLGCKPSTVKAYLRRQKKPEQQAQPAPQPPAQTS